MSHTPVGGHPQGWDHKLADRSSLLPTPGEEKNKSQSRHAFTLPHMSKAAGAGWCREQTEGSAGSSPSSAEPPYLRWARTLHDLLEDAEGVRQFRKFVSGAGGLHLDRLNFYFAVQGLRQEHDPAKIRQVISAIYKFLRKSQLAMPEALRARVKAALREAAPENGVFDALEADVTRAIADTTYPAFLRSDAYVAYVAYVSSPDLGAHKEVPLSSALGPLATLHEGEELSSAVPAPPTRLTHDALIATQARRLHSDIAPGGRSRSAYWRPGSGPAPTAAHLSYAGFCPASRVDSERASLSSGRADSDALSLSSSSTVDGISARGSRDRHRLKLHGLDRHAVINKDLDTAMMIPRSQRMHSEQLRVLPPAEFAPLLIEKLERVRRDQEVKERLERRLAEGDGDEMGALSPALVAAAIREKLQLDDDNDQDILDQHVSRVWSERTPGASPPHRRARRRPPSTLSADSGLYDEASASASASASLHAPAPRRARKPASELTDSGVSLLSEALEPRAQPCTVVVVTFLDENMPYRIRVPAAPLTLKLFKDYLPRKGNYRYFFKTECADLDNTVIQEEVSNDSDTLPMFEGKVMARVKSIE